MTAFLKKWLRMNESFWKSSFDKKKCWKHWHGRSVVLFPEVIYLCVTASWSCSSSSKNVTEKFFYFYYTSFTFQDSIVGVDELVTILQSLENVSQFDRVTRQLYSKRP